MFHLKGKRFSFPLIQRYGVLKQNKAYPITRNIHSGLEIHYVLKGEISWEVEGYKTPLCIAGGNFGIIPARTAHHALGDNGTPSARIGVIFDPDPVSRADGTLFTPDELSRMFARMSSCGATPHRLSPRLMTILRELSEIMCIESARDPEHLLRIRVLSSDLVHETYRILGEPEALADGRDVVPKIRSWIDAHCTEKISVPQLVKLSGYGRSRFFSLFLADTGMTPNDYLVRARIELSKRKLSKKRLDGSILDLAVTCGFNSASAFSTTFRKHVGLSPREFRAQRLAAS